MKGKPLLTITKKTAKLTGLSGMIALVVVGVVASLALFNKQRTPTALTRS